MVSDTCITELLHNKTKLTNFVSFAPNHGESKDIKIRSHYEYFKKFTLMLTSIFCGGFISV